MSIDIQELSLTLSLTYDPAVTANIGRVYAKGFLYLCPLGPFGKAEKES